MRSRQATIIAQPSYLFGYLAPMDELTNVAPRVGVLGGGSWATAIVKMLSNNLG